MKFQVFILFLVLFTVKSEENVKIDPRRQIYPMINNDQNTDFERKKVITDIESLLKRMIVPTNSKDLKELKRISVTNDIDGVNVNSDITGTEVNHESRNYPELSRFPHFKDSFEETSEDQNVAKSYQKHTKKAIDQLKSLVGSLARCQTISEKLLTNEVKSQKDLKVVRRRMAQELTKAIEVSRKIAPDTPNGIDEEETENLLTGLDETLKKALMIADKLSPRNIETKQDLMKINEKLEDEIDSAMEISQELAKKLENDEKVEDEKEIDTTSDDEDEKIVKALDRAIEIANKVDDKTLRRFAMKNKIRGTNVNANQNLKEFNFRNSPANLVEQSVQLRNYDSAEKLFPAGQPRYFWDEFDGKPFTLERKDVLKKELEKYQAEQFYDRTPDLTKEKDLSDDEIEME